MNEQDAAHCGSCVTPLRNRVQRRTNPVFAGERACVCLPFPAEDRPWTGELAGRKCSARPAHFGLRTTATVAARRHTTTPAFYNVRTLTITHTHTTAANPLCHMRIFSRLLTRLRALPPSLGLPPTSHLPCGTAAPPMPNYPPHHIMYTGQCCVADAAPVWQPTRGQTTRKGLCCCTRRHNKHTTTQRGTLVLQLPAGAGTGLAHKQPASQPRIPLLLLTTQWLVHKRCQPYGQLAAAVGLLCVCQPASQLANQLRQLLHATPPLNYSHCNQATPRHA